MSWHSIAPGVNKVYHNNKQCDKGDNIASKYKRAGTGGRRICERCAELNNKKRR
jgi:hypothetical protein